MLDLDTGVDLDEVVTVLLVDQELSGTGVAVLDRLGQLDSIRQDQVPHVSGQVLGGGHLDDLLVTTLDGAVTLEQVDDIAVGVTQQLDFNVLGSVEETLDEDGTVAKGGAGLGGGTLEGILQFSLAADDPHTTATTTKGGLDDDGETIGIGEALDLLEGLDRTRRTRNDGHVAADGQLTSGDLVTQVINGVRGGTNKDQTSLLHVAGKVRVFREETVTGVNEVHTVLEGNLDDFITGQISTDGGVLATTADHVGLVRLLTVHRETVLMGEDGNCLEGEFMCSTEDPNGDFTTVGYEDLLELHDGGIGPQTTVDRVLELLMVLLDELCIVDSLLGLTTECQIGGHDIDVCVCMYVRGRREEGQGRRQSRLERSFPVSLGPRVLYRQEVQLTLWTEE